MRNLTLNELMKIHNLLTISLAICYYLNTIFEISFSPWINLFGITELNIFKNNENIIFKNNNFLQNLYINAYVLILSYIYGFISSLSLFIIPYFKVKILIYFFK